MRGGGPELIKAGVGLILFLEARKHPGWVVASQRAGRIAVVDPVSSGGPTDLKLYSRIGGEGWW